VVQRTQEVRGSGSAGSEIEKERARERGRRGERRRPDCPK